MLLIAMVDWDWGIGRNGNQPIFIPQDLARFKSLTSGGTVIMGRKTLEALPSGRPLAGRRNIVLTRDRAYKVEGAEVVHSVEEVLEIAPDDAFVIGGEETYHLLLPFCDKAYITKVSGLFFADRFCPNLDEDSEWQVTNRGPLMQSKVVFHWVEYERKDGEGDGRDDS